MKPIYISGMYRSGTTLVTRILDNHPDLSVTYDSVHFMRFSYGKYDPISEKKNYTALINEIHERIMTRWEMVFDNKAVLKILEEKEKVDYADVYDEMMKNLMLKDKPHARWGEKTNVCWGQIPNFLQMFPDGKTINMVRDPRDTMTSFKKITYEPGYAYLDTAFAALNSFHSSEKFKKTLGPERFYSLRYETLIKDPKGEFKRICDFLEIEYNEKYLDTKKFKNKKGEWWDGDSSTNQAIQGISPQPIGRWKENLSNLEVYFVEMICREQMVNFGYDLEAKALNKEEWAQMYEILNDPFIKERYNHYLKTGDGLEAYPSDPTVRSNEEMIKADQSV